MKRVFLFSFALGVSLAIWHINYTSNWQSFGEKIRIVQFRFLEKAEGIYRSPVESSRLSVQCYGFVGECRIPALGIKLVLAFSGSKIKKPRFVWFNTMGGSTGWGREMTYYGFRTLTVSKENGQILAKFRQWVWNVAGYSDFSQILFIDLLNRRLLISNRDGFVAENEEGFSVGN